MLTRLARPLKNLELDSTSGDWRIAFCIPSVRRDVAVAAYTNACTGGGMAANCERQRHGGCKAFDIGFPDLKASR